MKTLTRKVIKPEGGTLGVLDRQGDQICRVEQCHPGLANPAVSVQICSRPPVGTGNWGGRQVGTRGSKKDFYFYSIYLSFARLLNKNVTFVTV